MTGQGSFQPLWKAADDEQEAKAINNANRLAALETVLRMSRIHPDSTAARLARLIFHITKNNQDGFNWKAERIALDAMMQRRRKGKLLPVHPRSVSRAACQLRAAGIILQDDQFEPMHGLTHVTRSIDWANVFAVAHGERPPRQPGTQPPTRPPTQSHSQPGTQPPTHFASLYSFPSSQEPKTPITTWETARGKVCKWVSDWVPPLKHCQAVGVSPDYVCQVVDLFEQAGGLWPPGGLRWRLLRAAPEIEPDRLDAWPPIAEPTGEERRACDMLANVRQWCQDKPNADPPEVIFRRAANDKGLGELVDRALFRERLATMAQV